jgi:hypothetical protein
MFSFLGKVVDIYSKFDVIVSIFFMFLSLSFRMHFKTNENLKYIKLFIP